jgi:hypothetical protein
VALIRLLLCWITQFRIGQFWFEDRSQTDFMVLAKGYLAAHISEDFSRGADDGKEQRFILHNERPSDKMKLIPSFVSCCCFVWGIGVTVQHVDAGILDVFRSSVSSSGTKAASTNNEVGHVWRH